MRFLVFALLALSCAMTNAPSLRLQGCEYVVDDVLGTPLPVRGGPLAREMIGTGFVCKWIVE